MNYELALELKKAGFTLPAHTDCDFESGGCCRCGDDDKEVCIPTLSELIEACGDDFQSLNRNTDDEDILIRKILSESGKWIAYGTEKDRNKDHLAMIPNYYGSTPEEAVAKLWLELNNI